MSILIMTAKRGRKPKYIHTIVLDGVNARDIYKKIRKPKKDYTPLTHISEYPSEFEGSTTQITDLSGKHRKGSTFLNPERDGRRITMMDHINYGCLPERTDLWCGHCHHPFNTSPIGIPIEYVPQKPDEVQPDDMSITGTNDYFLTSGIFCSFSCCLAFLNDYGHKSLYRNSRSLLYSLYFKLYQEELKSTPAPSWECLKVYGGHLSIDEFRKSFCNTTYVITENIKRPYMVAVGKYIEDRRCGFI